MFLFIFNIIKEKINKLDLNLSINYKNLLPRINSILIKLTNKLEKTEKHADFDKKKCDCNIKGIKDIFIENKKFFLPPPEIPKVILHTYLQVELVYAVFLHLHHIQQCRQLLLCK